MSLKYIAKKTKKLNENDIETYFVEGYKLPPSFLVSLYEKGKEALQEADPVSILAAEAKNLAKEARSALFPELDGEDVDEDFDGDSLFDEDKEAAKLRETRAPESLTKTNIQESLLPKPKPKPRVSLKDQGVEAGDLTVAQIVEAILLCTRSPLTAKKIATGILDATEEVIQTAIDELNQFYINHQRSFRIFEVAGGFQLRTDAIFDPWLKEVYTKNKTETLTPSSLETLAIMAYKQPITKSEVDNIRGVDSGGHIRGLMEKDLVEVQGKSDEIGNPNLYGTTKRFLELYGLNSINDLPNLADIKE